MSSDIKNWIEDASKKLGLNVKRFDPEIAKALVASIRQRFVDGNPRAWWMALKVPYTQYDSNKVSLSSVLPPTDSYVLLILETGDLDLPVFKLPVSDIEKVIMECPYFEYYVVGSTIDWLVAESDHNVFYVAERPNSGDVRTNSNGFIAPTK